MSDFDLAKLTISRAAQALRAGELSPLELLDATLRRIEELDPRVNAYLTVTAERARVVVRFEEGYGDALPFADTAFDRVTSSLMLHHLELATRRGMLREVLRVLRPGGSLHLLDFGWSGERSHGLLARLLQSAEHLRENSDARVAGLIGEAGFDAVERVAERHMLLGRVAFHRGRKASAPRSPSAIRE